MQQYLFNHFCTFDHCGFLDDVSLTFMNKTDNLIRLRGKTTGEEHLRLCHHLGLISKKVYSSFITNILKHLHFYKAGTFWGQRFSDISLISGVFFIFKDVFYLLLFWLLFVAIFVIIIIVFMIAIIIFIFIYFCFYYYYLFSSSYYCQYCYLSPHYCHFHC